MITLQEIVKRFNDFWEKQGCIIHQGYDAEVGAGTFNPATFLRSFGPEAYRSAYVEPCRRPTDGRYGENPNRIQHYFQYQVFLKPSPINMQELYLQSLEAIGFDLSNHDIRFIQDDWENPTIGAWGLGWEVWMDGMEVTQYTYFQSVGTLELELIPGELTYGIERLAMYLQNKNNIFDIQWDDHLTYGDIYHRNEVEWSCYNFEKSSSEMWKRHFEDYETEAHLLIEEQLPLPAYDFVMKASHAFNMLDARGVISVTERTGYIARIRDLAKAIAQSYIAMRKEQGFPLLKQFPYTKSSIPESTKISEQLEQAKSEDKLDFLLEIGSEELPHSFVPIGLDRLEKDLKKLLEKYALSYDTIKVYGTPRRVAVIINSLTCAIKETTIEKKGPAISKVFDKEGNLTKAGEGFFRSLSYQSCPTLEHIRSGTHPNFQLKKFKNEDYLYATITTPSKSTAQILQESLPSLICELDFPKKMRWADLSITYPRPIRWITALFGDTVIPFVVGNLLSSNKSYGHRQLCPGSFQISNPQSYLAELKKHQVVVDPSERKSTIEKELTNIEKTQHLHIVEKEKVLSQVLYMSENPQILLGEFNSQFLKIPKEVLVSEMIEHQKYFPLSDKTGNLVNQFVITADTTPTKQIKEGNERVLSARLSDGVFLYEKGLDQSLESYNEKLKQITFQKDLGSVFDKVQRIIKHAESLLTFIPSVNPKNALRAATLCKADLATEMVFEFPDLQGTIGKYYALANGEDPEVAQAIEEHWLPKGEHSSLPLSQAGIAVSLAEKFDNLLGCFIIGLAPTSSSDPYALRRQVFGIIHILISQKIQLPLKETLNLLLSHFPQKQQKNPEESIISIMDFITIRIKSVFQDFGFRKDEIEASLSTTCNDIYDTYCKVKALHAFRSIGPFNSLYEVYKRAKGQLETFQRLTFSEKLLQEKAEIALFEKLKQSTDEFEQSLRDQDYDLSYKLIAELQPNLETLFDNVHILTQDQALQNNRIALLQLVIDRFGKLLDFSKIKEKV